MKLTQTQNMKSKSGMTLLELTVVILVLLSLIAILFIGARAWKKGSDRAGCILNIRNVQQAVRGYANMNPGKVIATSAIFGSADGYMKFVRCPSSKDAVSTTSLVGYTFVAENINTESTDQYANLCLTCTVDGFADDHKPDGDTSGW